MMVCSQTSMDTVHQDPNRAESNLRTVCGKVRTVWNSQLDKDAFIFYDDNDMRSSVTNREMKDLCERGASLFHVQGVQKGDVVCNLLPNSLEREVINFAILLAGAVVMHGEPIRDTGENYWRPLRQAEVKYIVVDPSIFSPQWKQIEHLCADSDQHIDLVDGGDEIPTLRKIFKFRLAHEMKGPKGRIPWKSTFDILREHLGVYVARVSSHEPASIVVEPCAVQRHYRMIMRTHDELCQMAHRIEDMLECNFSDIIFSDIPLSWVPGLPLSYFSRGTTLVKSTLCYCPPSKVVRQTWDIIEKEQCTMAALNPPMIQMLSSHCDDIPHPKWQLRAITTAGLVPQSVMDAIGSCTESIITCYSLIEAGLVSRLVVTAETADRYSDGCVGDLSDPVRTKFVEERNSTKIGEILLQGKLVCREYYKDPHLTKAAFTKEGYLLTGDLGFMSESSSSTAGHLHVLGRKSEAIIRGNTAIFPREIEEKVNQCPGIWKVKVVSIKDDKGVVQMCACVVPRSQDALTIERVKEFCRYQLGGTHDDDNNPHMPTYVFFFDDFPMYKNKVNRRLLGFMASEIIQGNTSFTH